MLYMAFVQLWGLPVTKTSAQSNVLYWSYCSKKPKNGPINYLFSCLKKYFPSQQKNLFNANYSHTRVYFSFALLTVKILSQTPLFGSFHGAAYFTELLWYDLLNKIFLKCITRGYEFTLIQYLLLYYHNKCSTIFNFEIT